MEHSASTPEKAIERIKSWLTLTQPEHLGGTYFVEENPRNHPMRRYVAGYVKGEYEERIKNNSKLVNNILVIDNDLIPAFGWKSW